MMMDGYGRPWNEGFRRGRGPRGHRGSASWEGREGGSRMVRSSSVPRDIGRFSQQPWSNNCDRNQDSRNCNYGWGWNEWQNDRPPWEEGDAPWGWNNMDNQHHANFNRGNWSRPRGNNKFKNWDSRPGDRGRPGGNPFSGRTVFADSLPMDTDGCGPQRRVQMDEGRPSVHSRLQLDERPTVHQRLEEDPWNRSFSQPPRVTPSHNPQTHRRVTCLGSNNDSETKKQTETSQVNAEETKSSEKSVEQTTKQQVIISDLQIEEYDKSEVSPIPDYDPHRALGGSFVVPKIHYFCRLCKVGIMQNVNIHLKGLLHFHNLKQGGPVFSDVSSDDGSASDNSPDEVSAQDQTQAECPMEVAPPLPPSPVEPMESNRAGLWADDLEQATLEDYLDFD